jgi:flavodoxin
MSPSSERRIWGMRAGVSRKAHTLALVLILALLPVFHFLPRRSIDADAGPSQAQEVLSDKGAQLFIAYYSRSGKTRFVAKELATQLSCEVAEIRSKKKRDGVGVINCVLDALLNRDDDMEPFDRDLGGYDPVIVAAPIWVGKLSSPARTFVKEAGFKGKKVCLVITYNGDLSEEEERAIGAELTSQGIDLQGFYKILTEEKTEEEIRKGARAVSSQLACKGEGRK